MPKCYAEILGDCKGQIEDEHFSYLSKASWWVGRARWKCAHLFQKLNAD